MSPRVNKKLMRVYYLFLKKILRWSSEVSWTLNPAKKLYSESLYPRFMKTVMRRLKFTFFLKEVFKDKIIIT